MGRKRSPLFLLTAASLDISWSKKTTWHSNSKILKVFLEHKSNLNTGTGRSISFQRSTRTSSDKREKSWTVVKVVGPGSLETQRQQEPLHENKGIRRDDHPTLTPARQALLQAMGRGDHAAIASIHPSGHAGLKTAFPPEAMRRGSGSWLPAAA